MLETEINHLTHKDRVLNFVPGDESTKVACADRPQPCEAAHTGPSKAATPAPAFDDQVSESWTSDEIVGPSTDLRWIMVGLQIIAQTDSPVLILGEPGTCKEVIARSLHALSRYSNLAFVHVNCQLARPEEVLATLTNRTAGNGFRHFAGSGECHLAAGRTVFLEGVSELSPEAQEAVVKALQLVDGGREESISVVPRRIRLIASSDVNLLDVTKMGSSSNVLCEYLEDLEMHSIVIPSLRDRAEDMPMLVERFLEQYSRQHGPTCRSLSARAVELLQLYPWPGNLRELWQVMVRFTALRESERLLDGDKRLSIHKPSVCRPLEAVPELTGADDCDLIVASLLQTISLRSRGTRIVW